MNKLVAVVGMTGSGKSIVADMLREQGFHFVRFGQITLDIVKERGLPPTEENERPIREAMRKEHGMGAYAILNIPKFDALLEKGNVVADNMMSWSEYKILKEHYKENITVLAVQATPQKRYARLEKRKLKKEDTDLRFREATKEQAQKRDVAEIENIEKGGPIAMADYTIINEGPLEELKKTVQEFLAWLG